jgi:predicted XRE-type DNA-binding protein
MNPLQELADRVREQFPDVRATADPAATADGSSWLDLALKGDRVTVEWKPGRGFGVSAGPDSTYGEGSDELYPDVSTTLQRLVDVFQSRSRTNSNGPTLLKQLRQSQELSQEELAARMHVGQSAVSRLERRADVLLSTLRQVVSAMGGTLEIRVKFPNREVSVDYLHLSDPQQVAPRRTRGSRRGN